MPMVRQQHNCAYSQNSIFSKAQTHLRIVNAFTPKLSLQLQCPMPKLDFDIITLGHGSGGLLTNKLLESGVFDLLSNPILTTTEPRCNCRAKQRLLPIVS